MNEVEKFFTDILNGIKDAVKPKTTETNAGMNKKKIEVELPEPPPAGGFAGCPSGDNAYDDALADWRKLCNTKILEAIPPGYTLKSSEIKEERIVRHYADLVVEKS
jgi:hypothetical protein